MDRQGSAEKAVPPQAPAAARVPVDQGVRVAAATDLDRSWMLEAGAGTGKTSVLVARVVSILRSGRARLGEIAAITFTENAAADLKRRIREGIECCLAGCPDSLLTANSGADLTEAERERLQAALEEVDQAPVSTIHAFASTLLRERPVEAGLDPGFAILDALEEALLTEEAWRAWLLSQLEAGAPVLQRAVALGIDLKKLQEMAAELNRHADVLLASGPADPLPAGAAAQAVAGFVARFASGVQELRQLAREACTNPEDAGFLHIEELAEHGRRLASLPAEARERYLLHDLDKVSAKGNQKNWRQADTCARQKDLCRDLQDLLGETRGQVQTEVAARLLAWLSGFVTFYHAYKEERAVLGFHDLLLRARDLLRDHPPVRGYFQRRYRYLLVDEFQDTDPLQAEIVFFLAEPAPRARAWDQVELAPGKLFIVGDPKQSIYRFRRADIEMYEEAKEVLARCGCATGHLVQNFRTVPGVIGWVNAVFDPLIQPVDGCRYQPKYVPLNPHRDALGGEPGVVVLYHPPDHEAGNAKEVRAAEAACVARLVRRAVAEEGWPVLPRGADGPRPLRYGDVALLLPALTDVDLYEEALRREGVPYRLDGGKSFYAREEVQALVQALAALADPGDALATLAVLRSPLTGCSDEDLVAWAAAGGSFNYLEPLPPGGPAGVAETMALLRGLRPVCANLPLARAVEEAVRRLGAREAALAAPHGQQALANLAKVLDLARAFEARGDTFRRFARWLRDRQVKGTDEEESLVHDAADAVQLLTVHKAKGLEYPVAILVNLGAERSAKPPLAIVDRRGRRLEIRLAGFQTTGYQAALEAEKAREEAEHSRLFYVAATRARDHLVVSRLGQAGKGMLAYVADLPDGLPQVVRGAGDLAPGEADLSADQGASAAAVYGGPSIPARHAEDLHTHLDRWRRERAVVLAGVARGLPLASASGAAAAWQMAASATAEADMDKPLLPAVADELAAADDTEQPGAEISRRAVALGTAFHALMERVDLTAGDALPTLAGQVAREFSMEERREELLAMAWMALNAPVMGRVRAARRVWREMSFCAWVAGRLVEGAVDLVFEEPDGLVVVDFKTDQATGQELAHRLEHHRIQGAVYAAALLAVTGRPVKEAVFLFARTGEEHAFPGGAELRRLAAEALATAGQDRAAADPTPDPDDQPEE